MGGADWVSGVGGANFFHFFFICFFQIGPEQYSTRSTASQVHW